MKLKRLLLLTALYALILAQILSAASLSISAEAVRATDARTASASSATPDGLSFTENGKYVQQKPLWGVPEETETVTVGQGTSLEATKTLDGGVVSGKITFETTLYIPSTLAGNSITLFSNLYAADDASEAYLNTLSLEISYTTRKGGGWYPCIRFSNADNDGEKTSYRLTTATKIPKDTWTHVALVLDTSVTDENGYYDIAVYYNGSKINNASHLTVDHHTGTDDFGDANGIYNADNYLLGGTYVQARDGHFGGYLKSFSVFNEARTAAEIAEDYASGYNLTNRESTANTYDAEKMLCYYEFSAESVKKRVISDLSPMKNDLLLISGEEGIAFSHKDFLVMDKQLSSLPLTLEARVTVPSKGKFYPILYGFDQYGNNLCWGIQGRQVKLYYTYKLDGKSKQATLLFDQSIDFLPAGAWVDIAVTVDFENQQYKCYVNGTLVQTLSPTGEEATLLAEASEADYLGATFVVGSNCAWGNTANYYQGRISELALYADVRSDGEIFSDFRYGYETQDESIIAEYNLSELEGAENVSDKTGNGHDLRSDTWMTEEEADLPTDYAYSFAVVGDTQFLSRYNVSGFEDNLDNLYLWILDNQERFKTQHVFGLGDIVESGEEATNNPDGINEWAKAYKAISQMDGKISYSLVRGRAHDDPALLNQYMGTQAYYAMFEASEEYGFKTKGRIDNAYRTFTVGSTDYLFLMLDYGLGGDTIPWAEALIQSHPNHKVIITTHKYLNTDGTLESTGEAGLAAFGKYENVDLVLCGHAGGENIVYRQDVSPEGNVLTSMMINSQSMDKYYPAYGGFGMVAILFFSEDGNTVTVRYYSTVLERYFRPDNQFTLVLNEEADAVCGHDYDEALGACTLCGDFLDGMAALTDHKLTVGDDLNVDLYLSVDPSVTDAARFEIKNGEATLTSVCVKEAQQASLDSIRRISLSLPLSALGDTLTVQLIDGERAGALYRYSPVLDAFKLTGASVKLGATLSVNYHLSVLNEELLARSTPTMRFTVGDAILNVSEHAIVDGEYVFTLSGLSPQQLSDRIDASVFLGENEILAHNGYSIKKNLQNLLSADAATLGVSEEKHAAMVTLISDLLVYGAAAQDYTHHETDGLATSGVDGLKPSDSRPTEADRMTLTGNADPSLRINRATVRFDGAHRFYVEILADVSDPSPVTVKVNGAVYTLSHLVSLGNGVYLLESDALCVTQLARPLSVELSRGGTVLATLTYGVSAYAYETVSDGTENADAQAFALALYRYAQSAVAYTAIN